MDPTSRKQSADLACANRDPEKFAYIRMPFGGKRNFRTYSVQDLYVETDPSLAFLKMPHFSTPWMILHASVRQRPAILLPRGRRFGIEEVWFSVVRLLCGCSIGFQRERVYLTRFFLSLFFFRNICNPSITCAE